MQSFERTSFPYYSASPTTYKDSTTDQNHYDWGSDSWNSVVAQLPTPVSPISSMSKSPNASQSFSSGVTADFGASTHSRSFGDYKLDPREPRSIHGAQRYPGVLGAHHHDPVSEAPHSHGGSSYHTDPSTSTSQSSNLSNQSKSVLQSPFFPTGQVPPVSSLPAREHSSSQATKPARKNKAHVQKACFNCKRAHLSCDPARPCQRCITTGKQDSCYDVAHKKRGRPRLRDNPAKGQYAARRGSLPTGMNSSSDLRLSQNQYDMYRGQDSLRVLRSQPDQFTGAGNFFSPRQPQQAGYQMSFSSGYDGRYPVNPVAFLNLNLDIVRSNHMFSRIFGSPLELRNKNLESLVHVTDRTNIQMLRIRLKEEKDTRNFLPLPGNIGDNDGIPTVESVDYQRVSAEFQERSQTFWFHYASGQIQGLNVQIRLARYNTFFVVLVLPPFMDPPSTSMPMYQQMNNMPASSIMSYSGANFGQSLNSYGSFASVPASQGQQHQLQQPQQQQQQQQQPHFSVVGAQSTQQRGNSPPASASQSPLYTYTTMNSPPTVSGTPRQTYDASYFAGPAFQQQQYPQGYGYSQNIPMQSFGGNDLRQSHQYFGQDPSTTQANMQLPPIGSQQGSQQQQPRNASSSGLMQPGQGIGLSGSMSGQYYHQQRGDTQSRSDTDERDPGAKRLHIREII